LGMKTKLALGIILIIGISVLIFVLLESRDKPTSSGPIYYSCLDNDGSSKIRCVTSGSIGGCYGHNMLKSTDPSDGLVVTDDVHATCEGFSEQPSIFFTEDGTFVRR